MLPAAVLKALTGARSPEQNADQAVVWFTKTPSPSGSRNTLVAASWLEITCKVAILMVSRSTNAPADPWARTTPWPAPSS
jgi:hypothetical protein